jgi:colanic acid biosynthesis protein WcaH
MKLGKASFVEVVKYAPLVAIDLIIRNPAGQVLLGLRNNEPAKDYWFVPGGRIYKDETMPKAFQRITREELGQTLEIREGRFLGVYEHHYQENFAQAPGFGTHYIVLGYAVDLQETPPELPKAQHRQYQWVTEDQLRQMPEVHTYTKSYFASSVSAYSDRG